MAIHGSPAPSGNRAEALRNGYRLLEADSAAAAEQARAMLEVDADDGDALRLLGASLRRQGQVGEAKQAERAAVSVSSKNPLLVAAANAIADRDLPQAERLLRPYLSENPQDAAALLMLAKIAGDVGALDEAESHLRQTLTLSPSYLQARMLLAQVYSDRGALSQSLDEVENVLSEEPSHVRALTMKAALLGRIGDHAEAIAIQERLTQQDPNNLRHWVAFGHSLRTVGRQDDAVAAYRSALRINPGFGEAWWSLGNLKTVGFDDADIAVMETALQDRAMPDTDRFHIHFALAKAQEDARGFERAFFHYVEANRIRRLSLPYEADELSRDIDKAISIYTPEFVSSCAAEGGCSSRDPIFVVGMPRSGSTLLEQILSSHPMVEGTSELPYIKALDPGADRIPGLSPAERRRLGEEYLALVTPHRKTGRPFFVDKLPNNWSSIPFIHAILPNARIIDARRGAIACCWANFKQHFAQGQPFSYAFEDLARYHADYVRLLAHIEAVAPGLVHSLQYEDLIDDLEAEVRRTLDYLDLPFAEACLRFYENDRAVRTPSSEQVRRKIMPEAADQWRDFEPWLDPLKKALGIANAPDELRRR